MYAPTACTTPTRLPMLLWSLSAALLLLGAFAPAFAAGAPSTREAGRYCSLYSVSSKVVDSRTCCPAVADT